MDRRLLTIADASESELRIAREVFAKRYPGVDRDGWGPFTLEHQGATEIDRLLRWARMRAEGVERQREFTS